jgi:hypothetical protein
MEAGSASAKSLTNTACWFFSLFTNFLNLRIITIGKILTKLKCQEIIYTPNINICYLLVVTSPASITPNIEETGLISRMEQLLRETTGEILTS